MPRFAFFLSAFLCVTFAVALPASAGDWSPETKIQGFGPKAGGIYDPDLRSPKSAAFSPDGRKLYINALEAGKTLVYSVPSMRKVASIDHTFKGNEPEFAGHSTVFGYPFPSEVSKSSPNRFTGKPVEMAFSHAGRYLWIPYYRRSTDPRSAGPSAVAVVDTSTDRIVRLIPTGPLPKFVAISHDQKTAVVVHWGDNTLMKVDIASKDPMSWKPVGHWTVGHRLNTLAMGGNRDSNCGFCLRGAVFSTDDRTLLVARMGGGGIAGFDVASGKYLGTISNVPSTPRHLVLTRGGDLLASSNVSGTLSRWNMSQFVSALRDAGGRTVAGPRPQVLSVGGGARTVEVTPDGKEALVATNTSRAIAVVDLSSWKKVSGLPAAPFPVGLAISPDGCRAVSTSQGRSGQGGGNAVNIWNRCQGSRVAGAPQ